MEPAPLAAEPPGPVDAARPVLENHPALERLQHVRLEASLDEDVIDAADAVPGMGEMEREGAVVGQEEEPLGVEVEPPDRVEANAELRHEVEHEGPPARILPGGEEPRGLVKQHVALRLGSRERPPVDLDAVPLGVGVGAQLGHGHAVDADATRHDQPLGRPPRRDARFGQELVEPDGRHRPQAGDESPRSSPTRSGPLRSGSA